MSLTSYIFLVTWFLRLSPHFLLDKWLNGKMDISPFLQRALAWKFTHLQNSAQVMTLTSYITLATLFLGLSPHFILRKMVYLFRLGKLDISQKQNHLLHVGFLLTSQKCLDRFLLDKERCTPVKKHFHRHLTFNISRLPFSLTFKDILNKMCLWS
jgi:hypothetical protein